MKRLVFILLLSLSAQFAFAQPGSERFERIHAIKVAYITDKVHLSSEQAAKFWPVYTVYEKELRAIRHQFINKYKDDKRVGNDPHAARAFIEDDLEYQEATLNLRKKYKDEFLKIITPQQLAQLLQAERDFKRMLIQELKSRHGSIEHGDKTELR